MKPTGTLLPTATVNTVDRPLIASNFSSTQLPIAHTPAPGKAGGRGGGRGGIGGIGGGGDAPRASFMTATSSSSYAINGRMPLRYCAANGTMRPPFWSLAIVPTLSSPNPLGVVDDTAPDAPCVPPTPRHSQ